MIRVARVEDAASLQQVCYTATSLEIVRGWLDPAEDADRVVLVATTGDDAAIGNCTLTRHRHWLERHRAEIHGFVIGSDHRGTGVARRLVEACSDYARANWDAATLELAVRGGTHAEDAYRGLGFVEWARMPDGLHDRDGVYDDVRLFRPVDR